MGHGCLPGDEARRIGHAQLGWFASVFRQRAEPAAAVGELELIAAGGDDRSITPFPPVRTVVSVRAFMRPPEPSLGTRAGQV